MECFINMFKIKLIKREYLPPLLVGSASFLAYGLMIPITLSSMKHMLIFLSLQLVTILASQCTILKLIWGLKKEQLYKKDTTALFKIFLQTQTWSGIISNQQLLDLAENLDFITALELKSQSKPR